MYDNPLQKLMMRPYTISGTGMKVQKKGKYTYIQIFDHELLLTLFHCHLWSKMTCLHDAALFITVKLYRGEPVKEREQY